MAMADRMVADGYREAGYEYVHIDDCWAAPQRDENGKLQADPQRFPSGMQALADYLHEKRLKLGIYTDIGYDTCEGLPGSEFYMESDANTFAEWGVDLVKTDGCNADLKEMDISYPAFGFYLNNTGRRMVYGCSWPAAQIVLGKMQPNYASIRQHCNIWRNFLDVQDSWENVKGVFKFYGENKQNFANFSGPGGFSDPDQLLMGDYGLSIYQQKAQFGMWAMMTSPLFMSVDLRTIDPKAKAILLNKNVIAINQDPLGAQGIMLYGISNSLSVWRKPLAVKGSFAIAFLNEDDQGRPMPFSIHLGDIGLTNVNGYNVTNIFDNIHMGYFKPTSTLNVLIDPTSIVIVKAVPL
ncbi:alpha-galactosidase A-like isoform X2 [Littorina saxatilis]